MNPRPTGRRYAYLGAILGGAVSIAANVAHSYVPPVNAGPGWSPHTGAVVGAVFWPVALFIAVEIFARIVWPDGRRWTALRFLGLLPVALVAAVVSYRHLSGLLAFYREDALTVTIGPLAVDGLMVMATGALIATGARRVASTAAPMLAPLVEPAPAPLVPTVVFVDEVATLIAQAEADTAARAEAITTTADEPTSDVATVKRPAAARTTKRQPSAAERVAKAIARSPKASDATIAARLGLSEATVRRHRRQLVDSVATPSTPILHAA